MNEAPNITGKLPRWKLLFFSLSFKTSNRSFSPSLSKHQIALFSHSFKTSTPNFFCRQPLHLGATKVVFIIIMLCMIFFSDNNQVELQPITLFVS